MPHVHRSSAELWVGGLRFAIHGEKSGVDWSSVLEGSCDERQAFLR